MSPRVSVIIATYNWSSVLPYSIGSVLRQTMQDFEILVVGDGCTDDSEQVVAAIGDPRIRWFNLPANTRHQSGPNNEGLRQARGEFIAYLGHDDLWLPHHLEAHVAALDPGGIAMTYSLLISLVPEAAEPRPVRPRPQDGSWSPPSSTVHRRSVTEALGGWRDYREVVVPPEIDLWRRARAAGFEFKFVPRLTAIKFPASQRCGVYRTRPSHEQAAWSSRIASEPDLEATLLAEIVSGWDIVGRLNDRELVRRLIPELIVRAGRRLRRPLQLLASLWPRKGAVINSVRRFKGL
ncbi:MAG: glycosyltransferase family 2 protein [Acidobacteria bacterium]|nr:glycosyltransferase family 2 protein [Acidobacteriota bacterium]MBV9069215.1 glycosyltransferase family 2 protein [Acidobacteriota bacterium]MBV9183968.1 glycosyltransferase family 2 protein [Acidobacteriota bacterium]